jgi:nucleotide-binding universal stress UspA family protein
MKNSDSTSSIQRILVALDASPVSAEAIETAVQLAAHLRARLVGLFVEDMELIRVAEFPFAREVGSFSRSLRAIGLGDVERQLRVQAKLMQERLLAATRRLRVPSDFRVVRGAVGSEILSAATEADLVILGKIGRSLIGHRRMGSTARMIVYQGLGPTLILQQERVPAVAVSVIYDGSELAQKALRLARHFAQARKGALKLFVVAENQASARKLHHQALERLKGSDLEIESRILINQDLEGLAHIVRLEARGLLVLPCEPGQKEEMCWLVNQIPNPVLLVR